ncbi:MAG: hypothetical protein Fur0022_26720 [Anaerolineales bacterium]
MAINISVLTRAWWVGIILVGVLAFGTVKLAFSQSAEVWSPPINLSQSGSAGTPVVVSVPEGPLIVLWQDDFDGAVYSSFVEGQWSEPKAIEFPFEDYLPYLIADGVGNIHAFWIGDESGLFHSSVAVENFGTTSWGVITSLDASVVAFDVEVNSRGELSVSYVHTLNTEEFPTGVYYRKSSSGAVSWSLPIMLYESTYLRLLSSEQIKLELRLDEKGEDQQVVYVMWDNRSLGQLFLAISEDKGDTWNENIEIRGPDNADAIPSALGMILANQQLLLLWQEKISETNCRQYYQVYSLSGEVVTLPQPMLTEFPVCPENNQFISDGETIILETSLFNFTYLLAWDGSNWSEPQIQQELSNFINPNTLQPFALKCLTMMFVGDELLAIGCDNDISGDLWITSRLLESTSDWYSSPSSWSQPVSFFTSEGEITSLALASDSKGQLHSVWGQTIPNSNGEVEIYYARWDGEIWSYIVQVISPPAGRAKDISITIDQMGRLFVVWSGGQAGEIYFSWANAELAGTPSEWAKPVLLPMIRPVGTSPDISVGNDGVLYVTYAIPLNENRGIYLVSSNDGGTTWSDPIQVLDGVAVGWEMVGYSTLEITSSGVIHSLFWRLPPPDGLDSKALYYSRSIDSGKTWSTPEEIIRADLVSSWIEDFEEIVTYRIWQETKNKVLVTYLEASADSGLVWTEPINFTDFDSQVEISDVVLDSSGQLHLIQLIDDVNAGVILKESIWDGNSWIQEQRELIDVDDLTENWRLEAEITADGSLGVLITLPSSDTLATGTDIMFSSRKLESGSITIPPTPQVDLTPEESTPTIPTATPTSLLEVTPTLVVERPPAQTTTINTNILGPVVGLVASGFLVVLAFVLISRLANRNV